MVMHRRICQILLFLLPPLISLDARAQVSFSPDSRLGRPQFMQDSVRTVADMDLFNALDLGPESLRRVREAVLTDQPGRAYAAWGEYWNGKRHPRYITLPYKLLIDTDLLTSHNRFRDYIASQGDERDSILVRAGMIMQNTIRTWGDNVVPFGAEVDFTRELGQSGLYGFHYWLWARPLTMAYLLTNEERYLAKFDELFNRWYEQRNDVPRGFPEIDVVFYELGLGVRNRFFIEYYLLPYSRRPVQTHERMLKTMLAAGRWLYELERWEGYRAGNWQIHGAFMLAQIAMVFPEFKESGEWLRLGLQRMEEHLDRDFFQDGGHSERCPRNYTLATYLLFRNLSFLLDQYGVRPEAAAHIRKSLGKTVDWWVTMIAPTGEIPAINDSHRGLFPAMILRDGAEFFDKPEARGVMRALFGMQVDGASTLPPSPSRHMPASGFTVMRSDWTPAAHYMVINHGPFGGPHTHSDLLSFECYAFGRALTVDAGIGLTYDDSLYVPWYKSSPAHNMLVVNNRNMVREGVQAENVHWASIPPVDYWSGTSQGYKGLGVVQRRTILFVKPAYWVIRDSVWSDGGDTLSWYFHTAEKLLASDGGFQSEGSPGLLLLPAMAGMSVRKGTGRAASTKELWPGRTMETDWVAFDRRTGPSGAHSLTFLLFPFKERPGEVTVNEISGNHLVVNHGGRSDHLYLGGRGDEGAGVATDAECVLLRQEHGTTVEYAVILGTTLTVNGRLIWHSAAPGSAGGRMPE